jgi:hypothetical protein
LRGCDSCFPPLLPMTRRPNKFSLVSVPGPVPHHWMPFPHSFPFTIFFPVPVSNSGSIVLLLKRGTQPKGHQHASVSTADRCPFYHPLRPAVDRQAIDLWITPVRQYA